MHFTFSAFIMYLAMLTMTIYTHKTSCDSGNVTAKGLATYFDLSNGTLIPLISIIFIVFGKYSVFKPEKSFTPQHDYHTLHNEQYEYKEFKSQCPEVCCVCFATHLSIIFWKHTNAKVAQQDLFVTCS